MRETGVVRRPVREEGLVGTLFRPAASDRCPAVLALGGAGGGLSEGGAESLASEGFAALALAYFGVEPLPGELVEIPVEYFGRALAWLRAQPGVDAGRVAVVGNSKGGELALLLGTVYPEDVGAVVGYAPSPVVWQGIPLDREVYHGGPRSPWSLRGLPVPFLALPRPSASDLILMSGSFFGGASISGRPFYERGLADRVAVEAASIAVEGMAGPLMLISGTEDELWPSTRFCEMVVERLEARGRPFSCEHLSYEGAGHLITLPGYKPREDWIRRVKLGGSPEANEFANADSWPKVLGFLKERFGHGGR